MISLHGSDSLVEQSQRTKIENLHVDITGSDSVRMATKGSCHRRHWLWLSDVFCERKILHEAQHWNTMVIHSSPFSSQEIRTRKQILCLDSLGVYLTFIDETYPPH